MHCQTIQELEDHFGCKLESLATCMDLAAVGMSYIVTSTVVHPFHGRFRTECDILPPLYPKTKCSAFHEATVRYIQLMVTGI